MKSASSQLQYYYLSYKYIVSYLLSASDTAIEDHIYFYVSCHCTSRSSLISNKSHAYYCQIQTQLEVVNWNLAILFYRTENNLHIMFDYIFWREICENTRHLEIYCENLLADFTKKKTITLNPLTKSWCYCTEKNDGNMVCCVNSKWSIQYWQH